MNILLEQNFVPFEIAKLAKSTGFDELCFGIYDKKGELTTIEIVDCAGQNRNKCYKKYCYAAPLHQQLVQWINIISKENKAGLLIHFNGINDISEGYKRALTIIGSKPDLIPKHQILSNTTYK